MALDRAMPADVDIVVDAGNTGAAAIHYLPARRDGRFLVALGMGGMGYSFGAGVGMAFGRRRRTVVIAGDGAFFMHGMEIHTAIEYRLPVTFVLLNNNAHAMCVTREQLFYDGLYSYNRFAPESTRVRAGAHVPRPGRGGCRHRRRVAVCTAAGVVRRRDLPSSASHVRPMRYPRLPRSLPLHISLQEKFQNRKESATMSLPALDDVVGPIDGVSPYRDLPAGEGATDHRGDDAVGVPPR